MRTLIISTAFLIMTASVVGHATTEIEGVDHPYGRTSERLAYVQGPMTVGDMLDEAADRHGLPRSYVRAVAEIESGLTCGARNGQFLGVMQVGRGAAKEVGVRYPFQSCLSGIEAGVRYLKSIVRKYGVGCISATMYNEGPATGKHCSQYGNKVMRLSKKES
jgi:soluble lytic murein transglycosylase-like protein